MEEELVNKLRFIYFFYFFQKVKNEPTTIMQMCGTMHKTLVKHSPCSHPILLVAFSGSSPTPSHCPCQQGLLLGLEADSSFSGAGPVLLLPQGKRNPAALPYLSLCLMFLELVALARPSLPSWPAPATGPVQLCQEWLVPLVTERTV